MGCGSLKYTFSIVMASHHISYEAKPLFASENKLLEIKCVLFSGASDNKTGFTYQNKGDFIMPKTKDSRKQVEINQVAFKVRKMLADKPSLKYCEIAKKLKLAPTFVSDVVKNKKAFCCFWDADRFCFINPKTKERIVV